MKNFSVLAMTCILSFVCSTKPPKWSKNYIIRGTLNLVESDIIEPFQCWVDAKNKRVRTDFYYGAVKEFQFFKKDGIYNYRIIPTGNENGESSSKCLLIKKEVDNPLIPLPNMRDFIHDGVENVGSVKSDRFILSDNDSEITNIKTMWTKNTSDIGRNSIHPVRYEVKKYYYGTSSLRDYYYFVYDEYTPGPVGSEIFAVLNFGDCKDFPPEELNSFNPLKEFLHPSSTEQVEREFRRFTKDYNIKYANSTEKNYRMHVFMHNLRFIRSMNRANMRYKLGMNHFADRTKDELKNLRKGLHFDELLEANFPPLVYKNNESVPHNYDWRKFGGVGPVKDQGYCGCCWAFAVAGAIEGAYFRKSRQLLNLSVQALVDCSWDYGNQGCTGGTYSRAYRWMINSGGVPTEQEYGPYLGIEGYCHMNTNMSLIPISGFGKIPPNDRHAMKVAIINTGPISVAIDASQRSFNFYKTGIYSEPLCLNGNRQQQHAVAVVGYGKSNGKDYWIIKNSWSKNWGMNGYMLVDAEDNDCGISTHPIYVQI